MTNQCIEKSISDIDYQNIFPDIFPPANIWNKSYDESDEEESLSQYYTENSENIFLSYETSGIK